MSCIGYRAGYVVRSWRGYNERRDYKRESRDAGGRILLSSLSLRFVMPYSGKMSLSSEELEAERIYYGLCSCSLTKGAFVIISKDLEARKSEAGAYLRYLILRGQAWPRVACRCETKRTNLTQLSEPTSIKTSGTQRIQI